MKLLWKNEIHENKSSYYILKRQTATSRPFLPLHSHDYAEMVYLERGTCLHEANGEAVRVNKGDVLFIPPNRVEHRYIDVDNNLSLLQILFQKDSFSFISERYRASVGGLFSSPSQNPLHHFDPMQQIWFERNYNQLMIIEGSLIEIERFLLNIIGMIHQNNMESPNDPIAKWINSAFREIQEPEHFRKGVQGFVELCNRSAEHVEREVKKRTGYTITDVVNQARMSWTSYMLIYSDAEIRDIALGCGLESLSHFYKVFKKHYSLSPGGYRKQMGRSSSFQYCDVLHPYLSGYLY